MVTLPSPVNISNVNGCRIKLVEWFKDKDFPARNSIITDGAIHRWIVVAVDEKTRIISLVRLTLDGKQILKSKSIMEAIKAEDKDKPEMVHKPMIPVMIRHGHQ